MKIRFLIMSGIVSAIVSAIFFSLFFISYDEFFSPMSNKQLIENSKTFKGVQIFLERYPDAKTSVYKGQEGEKHHIVYRVDIQDGSSDTPSYIVLTATLSAQGFPQDLKLECWNGLEMAITSEKNNVESAMQKYLCEDQIPELNHLIPAETRPSDKNIEQNSGNDVGDAVFSVVILNPNDIDPLAQTKITLGEPIDDYDSGVTFSPNYIKTILDHNNTITWINENKKPVLLESDDGYFKTQINPTESFSAKFNKVGVYRYHSTENWKRGTILVSAPDIESSNLEPAGLLQKDQYEIAKIIATSLIPDDDITNARLENTIVSAYVSANDADIIVPKSLGILNSLETFDAIEYRYGMTKGLFFPKDEQEGLDFAKRFLEKIGYPLDGSEWIDKVNFGNRIEVTIQQRIQGWIIPNHIVRFDFSKDHTWITLGRWYNDAAKYEFKLGQDDAKKIAKDYMDVEVKSRPVFEKYDYRFESVQDGVRVIIFDDKPFYMVPITYKANADMEYEIGHCGSNQFLTVYVMVEGKTGAAMGWNYPGCE
ncbi:MAG TPA: hypothetical protein VNK07_00270 [Candidatus Binatia bacterium]|nr:hypothetical protein [Candidatus Binatia bacterium]